jgi:hypothetical protein
MAKEDPERKEMNLYTIECVSRREVTLRPACVLRATRYAKADDGLIKRCD